jgi:hypothetical protein
MRARSVAAALALTAASLLGPILLTNDATTVAQDFCSDWLFVGDVCEVADYCWETNDPVCDQVGNQAPRYRSGT